MANSMLKLLMVFTISLMLMSCGGEGSSGSSTSSTSSSSSDSSGTNASTTTSAAGVVESCDGVCVTAEASKE